MPNILIDGDTFPYRCGFASEKTKYLVQIDNPTGFAEFKQFDYKKEADAFLKNSTANSTASGVVWSRKDLQPLEYCLQTVKQSLGGIYDTFPEAKFTIFLSGRGNFRESLAVSKVYKGNRDNQIKPTYFKDIREYLIERHGAIVVDGIEADDAVSIEANRLRDQQFEYIVVAQDKDLNQIPGHHYNWVTKERYHIGLKDAAFWLYSQILSGDPTDNVPGLKGIGPEKARELLKDAKNPNELVDICADAYKNPELMLEMANLVYLLREPGKLWSTTKQGEYFVQKYWQDSQKQTQRT